MLMRTDPFRDLDRLTQQVFGTMARPAAMPMDAFRKGDTFYVKLDLPGITLDAIDLTVEQNVLTVRAERAPAQADGAQLIVAGPVHIEPPAASQHRGSPPAAELPDPVVILGTRVAGVWSWVW